MPVISIVIPVYNVESFLEDSLNSVINQTFEDFEVICVDDGSTDNSLEILNDFKNKDFRVKVIAQKNKGNGGARNTGLKHATGEYVYFMDADDVLFENALEKMYNNIINNNSDIVIFKIAWLKDGEPLSYKPQVFPFDEVFKNKSFDEFTFTYKDVKYYIMNYGTFAIWAKFYKKEFLDKYKEYFVFPENTAFADVRFHVASLILASKISFEDDFLYQYRLSNQNSVTNTKSNRMDIFNVVDSVENFLKQINKYEELKDEFIQFKIHQYLHYIPSANSTEFFQKVREEFLKMNIEELSINSHFKGRYKLLIDSDNYTEYLHDLILYNDKKNDKYKIISNNKELLKLKKENKKLKKEIKKYKELNSQMRSSKSWKITEPLRKLKR